MKKLLFAFKKIQFYWKSKKTRSIYSQKSHITFKHRDMFPILFNFLFIADGSSLSVAAKAGALSAPFLPVKCKPFAKKH